MEGYDRLLDVVIAGTPVVITAVVLGVLLYKARKPKPRGATPL